MTFLERHGRAFILGWGKEKFILVICKVVNSGLQTSLIFNLYWWAHHQCFSPFWRTKVKVGVVVMSFPYIHDSHFVDPPQGFCVSKRHSQDVYKLPSWICSRTCSWLLQILRWVQLMEFSEKSIRSGENRKSDSLGRKSAAKCVFWVFFSKIAFVLFCIFCTSPIYLKF